MWIGDKYTFVDWRYGKVTATRATLVLGARAQGALSPLVARQIVMALARDAGARHHLVALGTGVGVEVNVAALGRTPTPRLALQLLRAIERGRLLFWSADGEVPVADQVSSETAALIVALMPQGDPVMMDGQQYRLAPLKGRRRSEHKEVVLGQGEARAVLARMQQRYAANPADKALWEQAVELVRDGTVRPDDEPDTIVLLRILPRAPAPAPTPSGPAVTPSSLAQEEPVAPEESDEAPEFSCADEQAEAMAAAARDGVPFCLECACGEAAAQQSPSPETQPQA